MSERSRRLRNRNATSQADIVCQCSDLTARKQFHNGKPQKKGAEWIDHDLLKGIESVLFKRSCRRLPRLQVTSLPLLDDAVPGRNGLQMVTDTFSDDELSNIEREYARGVSSEEIVGFFTRKGVRFTEATLRKYVQLGLLPRSRRVGLKGKQRGSQGLYPVAVVRRIQRLKVMLATYTMEEIQREFLFVRADVEELERTLERIFLALSNAAKSRAAEGSSRSPSGLNRVGIMRELSDARGLAAELVGKVTSVETRLTMQARLQREAI